MRSLRRVAIALGFLTALSAVACRGKDDRAQIIALIEKAADAASDRNPSGVMERVADQFCGTGPTLRRNHAKGCAGAGKREVKQAVLARLLPPGWVRVWTRDIDVQFAEPTHASASFVAIVARGEPVDAPEDLLPSNADILHFEMKLEKRPDGWWFVEGSVRRGTPAR